MTCCFSVLFSSIVVYQIFKYVLPWFYKNFIGPKFFGPKINFRKMGEWALVTGATEGIGKAYAKALAKEGLNIILISRSEEKLANVAKEIEDEFKVKVKIIAVDFTHGLEIYKTIEQEIQGLKIGILVNNVGVAYSCPEYFLELPNLDKFLQDIILLNVHSVTHMCKIILPGMVERKKGVIINISSMTAVLPSPLLSIYSGTKAFVDKFSEDLGTEYKNHGIIIQSVMPGFVATKLSKIKKTSFMIPTPDVYAESALKTVGIDSHTYGYFPHSLMKLGIDISTILLSPFGYNYIFEYLLKTRSKMLKKSKSN